MSNSSRYSAFTDTQLEGLIRLHSRPKAQLRLSSLTMREWTKEMVAAIDASDCADDNQDTGLLAGKDAKDARLDAEDNATSSIPARAVSWADETQKEIDTVASQETVAVAENCDWEKVKERELQAEKAKKIDGASSVNTGAKALPEQEVDAFDTQPFDIANFMGLARESRVVATKLATTKNGEHAGDLQDIMMEHGHQESSYTSTTTSALESAEHSSIKEGFHKNITSAKKEDTTIASSSTPFTACNSPIESEMVDVHVLPPSKRKVFERRGIPAWDEYIASMPVFPSSVPQNYIDIQYRAAAANGATTMIDVSNTHVDDTVAGIATDQRNCQVQTNKSAASRLIATPPKSEKQRNFREKLPLIAVPSPTIEKNTATPAMRPNIAFATPPPATDAVNVRYHIDATKGVLPEPQVEKEVKQVADTDCIDIPDSVAVRKQTKNRAREQRRKAKKVATSMGACETTDSTMVAKVDTAAANAIIVTTLPEAVTSNNARGMIKMDKHQKKSNGPVSAPVVTRRMNVRGKAQRKAAKKLVFVDRAELKGAALGLKMADAAVTIAFANSAVKCDDKDSLSRQKSTFWLPWCVALAMFMAALLIVVFAVLRG